MTLAEFLETANADDNVALAEAKAYTTSRVWRIEGAVRKTQVETTVIVNDTTDRLEASITTLLAIGSPTATEAAQLVLSKAILRALNKLYEPEFYINLADPTIAGMLANAQALGVLNQAEIDGITAAATYTETPFADITLEDVTEARDGGEVILLAQNNAQHVVTVNITTQPRKATNLKIQHRFGSSVNDLTEWHDCGTVQNTFYTQRTYQTMIPASPTAYRELRLVSPLTLGVSISTGI
jgi:metal-sulfur cluster biosynthetic enzyme